jgi:hypothetical protein
MVSRALFVTKQMPHVNFEYVVREDSERTAATVVNMDVAAVCGFVCVCDLVDAHMELLID